MKNKDPLGFDAGLARLARYVPEAQAGAEDDAQARTENKDPGNGGSPQARFLPSPREPMAVARRFLTEAATDAGTGELKLRHWRGGCGPGARRIGAKLKRGTCGVCSTTSLSTPSTGRRTDSS